jgi:hypothetical protein
MRRAPVHDIYLSAMADRIEKKEFVRRVAAPMGTDDP